MFTACASWSSPWFAGWAWSLHSTRTWSSPQHISHSLCSNTHLSVYSSSYAFHFTLRPQSSQCPHYCSRSGSWFACLVGVFSPSKMSIAFLYPQCKSTVWKIICSCLAFCDVWWAVVVRNRGFLAVFKLFDFSVSWYRSLWQFVCASQIQRMTRCHFS